ncbi:AAA family ATPase [Micromonospora echinaurantiaca]|uniref:AAA family ATPase n=1 Tax=Micromonospora echinaurantiaca TaxID=47857 RepID=UPI0037212626
MRLLRLGLKEFKNLRDFAIEFDPGHAVSVIVGRNGTGKSNLLESLSIIFRDLDLGEPTPFQYSLDYECRGHKVSIRADPTARARRRITIDGRRASLSVLQGKEGVRLLPDFVFGYYSGPTNRLEQHFSRHHNIFNKALRDGDDRPLRRLFYAQPTHSQFVLLAFFLDDDPAVTEFLKEYLRIESLESVLFILREPPWSSNSGNARFWNARGAVADLLDHLYDLSLAPMRLSLDADIGGRRSRREHLYLYLQDLNRVRRLANESYGNDPQALFKAFESILAADLLSEVRVRVRAHGVDGSLVFRELSEGEQQLLMVLGLLRFTRENESLFLLDEPDTHLNPSWSLRYTEMLEEHSGAGSATSQLVMATHDPLVIAGLRREQVAILDRESSTGEVKASRPEKDPQGMGVAGLLTSDVYDLASELDKATLDKLEKRRWLAAADDLSPEEAVELANLTKELEDLDFTFTTRDPLYTEFERAMASIERVDRPVLSREEGEKERRDALETLRQLVEDANGIDGGVG